jgi:hypothetical protein
MMELTEWFNPTNRKHLLAYRYCQETGMWPEGFIPDDVEVNNNWQMILPYKMADLWILNFLHITKPI